VGDLGGVEELGALIVRDNSDEHSVSYAGDEIADVFIPGKQRHGVAVGTLAAMEASHLLLPFARSVLLARVQAFKQRATAGFAMAAMGSSVPFGAGMV
jgi:hypothetical protein